MVHYRTRHDSVYVTRHDTIPIAYEVERVKEVPRGRTWLDWVSYASLFLLITWAGKAVWKFVPLR